MIRNPTGLSLPIACLAVLMAMPLIADQASIKAGREAVDAWLVIHDEGKYDESRQQSAAFVKKVLTEQKWQTAMLTHRGPLGAVKSRALQSASYATELPGMPDGKYVVLTYKTSFEKKKSAIETIIPMQEEDGKWKVMTYRIR